MDGSANNQKKQRTLASQPAAAAYVGADAAPAATPDFEPAAIEVQRPRTRLEKMLLLGRQLQQQQQR